MENMVNMKSKEMQKRCQYSGIGIFGWRGAREGGRTRWREFESPKPGWESGVWAQDQHQGSGVRDRESGIESGMGVRTGARTANCELKFTARPPAGRSKKRANFSVGPYLECAVDTEIQAVHF